MQHMFWILRNEFIRVNGSNLPDHHKLALIADMCRANTLTEVKKAGSGHLGSSLSAMDIVVFLYWREMNTIGLGWTHPDRDIYFSSKGHDVPGLYALLYALGVLPLEKLLKLRRLGGLDGHPDVRVTGIESNSGSLGMGISKAKGMLIAKKMAGRQGRVFVLTGDGELQEGQNYEAMQNAVQQKANDLIVIVDHNKVQSDKLVKDIVEIKNLEEKFRDFGWYVKRCNGHDFQALETIMADFKTVTDRPKVLIADTIKGKGVSFMEHPRAIEEAGGLYRWHSGAPGDDDFEAAYREVIGRIERALNGTGLDPLKLEKIVFEKKEKSGVSSEYVVEAFGDALVDIAKEDARLVVLDADLAADCRIRKFEEMFPGRFIECGIAEQDMVSTAGGLALQGYLPVVNSFAAFLSSRANEQIYTNACEKTKIIYVMHYSGLIPAGPGMSHQSIRDISLLSGLPNMEIIQPANGMETKAALKYCVAETGNNCVLRLIIGPSPRVIELPDNYTFRPGRGTVLVEGRDAVLFAYGPVMLHEALNAAAILSADRGLSLKVVNMPWMNRVDIEWLKDVIGDIPSVYVVDDHTTTGGLADHILRALVKNRLMGSRFFDSYAVEGFPECGTPGEVLKYHGLDGESIANRIINNSGGL